MAGGLQTLANLLGKVNANNALVVALDGGTASATKFLAGDGTAAAPSYSFASETGLGWYRAGAGEARWAQGGFDRFALTATSFNNFSDSGSIKIGSSLDVSLSRGAANNLALAAGDSMSIGGATGAATTATKLIKKVTGIADNTATDVITVTVSNQAQSAGVKLSFVSSNGSTDAFESSRVAEGFVVLARTSGVATVATVAALGLAQIATVGGGATHTLAYGVSAMTGAAGATQTFTIQVTIDDSGNLGSNQVLVVAEVINSQSNGVTIQ